LGAFLRHDFRLEGGHDLDDVRQVLRVQLPREPVPFDAVAVLVAGQVHGQSVREIEQH